MRGDALSSESPQPDTSTACAEALYNSNQSWGCSSAEAINSLIYTPAAFSSANAACRASALSCVLESPGVGARAVVYSPFPSSEYA